MKNKLATEIENVTNCLLNDILIIDDEDPEQGIKLLSDAFKHADTTPKEKISSSIHATINLMAHAIPMISKEFKIPANEVARMISRRLKDEYGQHEVIKRFEHFFTENETKPQEELNPT